MLYAIYYDHNNMESGNILVFELEHTTYLHRVDIVDSERLAADIRFRDYTIIQHILFIDPTLHRILHMYIHGNSTQA